MDIEDLLDAVEDGDIDSVQEALEDHKVDINSVDEEGFTPLMLAAHCGQDDVLDYLLEKKAKVDCRAGDGSDALMCAVQGGFDHSVQSLLDAKASANATEQSDFSPMYSAAQEGHVKIVRKLAKHKADIDAKCQGVSPLFIAAQENHLGVVQALLSADCDVNATNPSRATPLFIAVQKGNTSIVKSMIKRKKKELDFEKCTKQGLTALLVAIKIGHLDESKLLIKGGASINNPCEADGNTPLMTAALYGDIDVMEELVGAGADLNAHNDNGDDAATILMREYGEDLNKILAGHGLSSAAAAPPPPPPPKKKDKKHKKHKKKAPPPPPTKSKGKDKSKKKNGHHKKMDVQTSQALANAAMIHFQKYDTDRSGSLEYAELVACLDDMGCRTQLGDEKFTKLVKYSMKNFDKDKDGQLDFSEFVKLYNKLQATVERVQRRKKANVTVDDHSVKRRSSSAAPESPPEREGALPSIHNGPGSPQPKGIANRLRRGPGGNVKRPGGPKLHRPSAQAPKSSQVGKLPQI